VSDGPLVNWKSTEQVTRVEGLLCNSGQNGQDQLLKGKGTFVRCETDKIERTLLF